MVQELLFLRPAELTYNVAGKGKKCVVQTYDRARSFCVLKTVGKFLGGVGQHALETKDARARKEWL